MTPPVLISAAGDDVEELGYRFSADDRWLLFVMQVQGTGQNNLYLVDLQASPLAAVRVNPVLPTGAAGTQLPAFSPDSTRLFYMADLVTSDHYQLYMVDLGGTIVPVALNGLLGPNDPGVVILPQPVRSRPYTVSPDGQRLSHVAVTGSPGQRELFRIDLSAQDPAQSTVRVSIGSPGEGVRRARWSPDGQSIAYIADQDVAAEFELFLADVSGPTPGPSIQLSAPLPPGGDVISYNLITFGLDSSFVIFGGDIQADGLVQLFVVDLLSPTLEARVVGPPGEQTVFPKLAPDGSRVAYESQESGERLVVHVTLLENRRPTSHFAVHSPGEADVRALRWTHDSRRLFIRGEIVNGEDRVHLVDTSRPGSPPIPISDSEVDRVVFR